MKNQALTLLFSLASTFVVRVAMLITGAVIGFGVLGEDTKELSEVDKEVATAAAEVAAERAAEGGGATPAQIAVSITLLLGVGFEWLKSYFLTRGTKRIQNGINALGIINQQGIHVKLDGLPFDETQTALNAAVRKASTAAAVKGFPAVRRESAETTKVEGRKGRTITGIGLTIAPMLIFMGLAFSNVACSSIRLPGGWEEIQSVTDKVAVSGKARPLPDGVELCLQVRRKPDVSEELVEISVEPGK